MLIYSESLEYIAARRDEPHLISRENSEIVIASQTVDSRAGTNIFIVCLEPQTTALKRAGCAIGVSVD